jgi:hypothetical protein
MKKDVVEIVATVPEEQQVATQFKINNNGKFFFL